MTLEDSVKVDKDKDGMTLKDGTQDEPTEVDVLENRPRKTEYRIKRFGHKRRVFCLAGSIRRRRLRTIQGLERRI